MDNSLFLSVVGALFLILLGIISYFIRQTIESRDSKLKELNKDYNDLEIKVQEFKTQVLLLANDVSDNRKQLIIALSSVKDFIAVNDRIEKQLERGNDLNEELKDLMKIIVESLKFNK